ncbi:MAG: hypothetical protein R3E96_16435 [Planctomycetota bacterium]
MKEALLHTLESSNPEVRADAQRVWANLGGGDPTQETSEPDPLSR